MLLTALTICLFLFGDSALFEWTRSQCIVHQPIFRWIDLFIDFKVQSGLWICLYFISNEPRRRKVALMTLLSLGMMVVLTYALKIGLGRARPILFPQTHLFNPFTLNNLYHSCPSSHAATIMISALGVSKLHKSWRMPMLVAAGVLSFSRTITNHHYPSDLCVGMLVAHACFATVANRFDSFQKPKWLYAPKWKRPLPKLKIFPHRPSCVERMQQKTYVDPKNEIIKKGVSEETPTRVD